MAVTTQESPDGVREKAMTIASVDELERGSSTARWPSPGGAENDRTGKANQFVRSLVGMKKEGDIIVASGSESKLWRDMSLKLAIQDWNVKYVDVARSPGSKIRVFTSSERLANQLKKTEMDVPKVEEVEVVGKLVERIHMGSPQARKRMKNVKTGDRKVGELVKRIQMNDPKVGKDGNLVR